MARLRYDLLHTALGAQLDAAATTITFAAKLTAVDGDIPTIGDDDYLVLTIGDANDPESCEIVYLTDYTSEATTGTITRGEEGTIDQTHTSGSRVRNSPTTEDFGDFIPQGGPLTEPLDTGSQILFAGDPDTGEYASANIVISDLGEGVLMYGTSLESRGTDLSTQFAGGSIPDLDTALFALSAHNSVVYSRIQLLTGFSGSGVELQTSNDEAEEILLLAPGDGATVTHDELPYTGPLPVAQSLSTGAPVIRAFATITQTDYDALDPPDANTLYVVEDSGRVYLGADLIANATDPTTVPVTDVSGTTDTIDADDLGKILRYTDSALVTVTLPDGLPIGSQVNLLFWGAAGGAVQDNGTSTVQPEGDVAQYHEVSCVVVAANTWSVQGPVT